MDSRWPPSVRGGGGDLISGAALQLVADKLKKTKIKKMSWQPLKHQLLVDVPRAVSANQ